MGEAYPLGELIGAGGMGAVHATHHDDIAVPIVIKVLRPELGGDPAMLARFGAETRAVRRLDHPNVVRYVDAGEGFLVMERAPGVPLGTAVAMSGPLSIERASEIAVQILRGLAHAHARGVIHADVKTANVLTDVTVAGDQTTLIDFGVARVLTDSVAAKDCLVSGTPEYMAPEVIRGQPPTLAADLYGVGVILYELLTGTTPYGGGTIDEILARHLEDDLVPPSLRCPERPISPALDRIIMRALAKDPARRFPSATTFAVALRDAVRGVHDLEDAAAAAVSATAFSTEAPTITWASEPLRGPQQRSARGTRPGEDRIDRARASIGDALVRGDLCDIADGYLELARLLVNDRRLRGAITELEEAIDLLMVPSAEGRSAALPLWPILLTLAALHDGSGDRQRACSFGRRALADAAACDSTVGVSRAARLLTRLSPRCELHSTSA